MTILREGQHPAEFLISEGPGTISREEVTVQSGEVLEPGYVLGQIADNEKWVQHDPDATDGSADAKGIAYLDIDASGGDVQTTIIRRLAEVNGAQLIWKDSNADVQGTLDLAAQNIIVR
jgi:hypothetical protein